MTWHTWVFSGIGVAVPIALLSWLVFGRRNRGTNIKQAQRGGDNSTNVQIGKSGLHTDED